MLATDHQPHGNSDDLTASQFEGIRLFLIQQCGIELADSKHYLLKSRLSPLLGKYDVNSFAELSAALQSSPSAKSHSWPGRTPCAARSVSICAGVISPA